VTLDLATLRAALLTELDLGDWPDALTTLALIRRDYPDEGARIATTLIRTLKENQP